MRKKLGENWVLLRGLARESGHWADFPEAMKSAFPNAQVSTLDLPGSGEFYREASPRTLPAITAYLRAQAEERGLLAKPATLFALSLGGMVAYDWLQRFPEEICGGVLVNSSLKGLNPFYQRLRWQIYAKFIALLFVQDIYQRELAILQLVSNRSELQAITANHWAALQKRRPMAKLNVLNQLLAAASARIRPVRPTQPILLLNSRGDRLVDPDCSETIRQRWHCSIKTHPNAGHDLTLDDSAWVITQLLSWVASHQAAQMDNRNKRVD